MISEAELSGILSKHRAWLNGNKDGEYANLSEANLRGANLREANLSGANLREAKNLQRIFQSPLSILQSQGDVVAFKYLNRNKSPYQGATYEVGKTYEEQLENCDMDIRDNCGPGLNVATLDWCLQDTNCNLSKTYIKVRFSAADIIAIPYNSNGKFRVRKFTVVEIISKAYLEEYLKPLYPAIREPNQ